MSTDNGVDAHRPILCMPIRNNKFEIIGKLLNNMFSTWGDVQAHNLINYISSPLLLPPLRRPSCLFQHSEYTWWAGGLKRKLHVDS